MHIAWGSLEKRQRAGCYERIPSDNGTVQTELCVEGQQNIFGQKQRQVFRLLAQSGYRHQCIELPTGAAEHGQDATTGYAT